MFGSGQALAITPVAVRTLVFSAADVGATATSTVPSRSEPRTTRTVHTTDMGSEFAVKPCLFTQTNSKTHYSFAIAAMLFSVAP